MLEARSKMIVRMNENYDQIEIKKSHVSGAKIIGSFSIG
jgi:hypothetical protein